MHGKGDTSNDYIIPYNVTVNCVCPQTHYWKLQKYTYEGDDLVQTFRCVKVRLARFMRREKIAPVHRRITYVCMCVRWNFYAVLRFNAEENVRDAGVLRLHTSRPVFDVLQMHLPREAFVHFQGWEDTGERTRVTLLRSRLHGLLLPLVKIQRR